MKRVYEKAGYRHEGTARKMFWRDGRWYDVSLFAVLEEDWFSNLPAN
jgi:RimJ/RimL family protein N-acetyltransferase